MIPVIALLLDAVFGEPRVIWSRLPHPAVLMGRTVGQLDQAMNFGDHRRLRGAFALAFLIAGAWAIGAALAALPGHITETVVLAVLLAQRSLSDHVLAVATGLRRSLGAGQDAVGQIVSRDTAAMDAPSVARAAIESAAENLSDGVIAPLFWFVIAGLPGLLIYKIVNTADSMIGYRTPRYLEFGWAAARSDDLLNLIPARLTAMLLWLTAPGSASWPEIAADARMHRSPNAGWPEAAMARALNVSLAGPRSYNGQLTPFPFVNPEGSCSGYRRWGEEGNGLGCLSSSPTPR